jgi:hypothetical protein
MFTLTTQWQLAGKRRADVARVTVRARLALVQPIGVSELIPIELDEELFQRAALSRKDGISWPPQSAVVAGSPENQVEQSSGGIRQSRAKAGTTMGARVAELTGFV